MVAAEWRRAKELLPHFRTLMSDRFQVQNRVATTRGVPFSSVQVGFLSLYSKSRVKNLR
jgi:hypothetical protein